MGIIGYVTFTGYTQGKFWLSFYNTYLSTIQEWALDMNKSNVDHLHRLF